MRHRLAYATACLHISAVLYLLLGCGAGLFAVPFLTGAPRPQSPRDFDPMQGLIIALLFGPFCLVLVLGIEIVAWGLRKRKFWAWIAGLCIFGMYLPSLFLPLGAFGMWGLLDEGSRREFGVDSQRPGPGTAGGPGL